MTSALGLKLRDAIETAEARKAMEDWTKPISVSEASFNAVRDNPGLSKTKICAVLEKQGYKPASTTSLLSAMLRYGIVVEEDGGLRAIGDTYRTRVVFNPRLKRKVAKVATVAKVVPQAPRSTIITTNFDVDSIIKNLTIYQAKELRDALNNLFK
jgi:hypothetical protein